MRGMQSNSHKRLIVILLLSLALLCLGTVLIYNLPPVHERLSWRAANWSARLTRFLNPPQRVVFVPQEQNDPQAIQTIVKATLDIILSSATPSPSAVPTTAPSEATATALPTATPLLSATPSPTSTPIPSQIYLEGIAHEYQQFNNCGPANLSMALSYWGWQGNQNDTRAFLRPNRDVDDKNVMPGEMVAFVENTTPLRALTRVGGDLDSLKRLLAAGFPVLVEMGHHPPDDWWMGHFLVINGYDDSRDRFTTQDSLIMSDFPLPYEEIKDKWWRDFNYIYLVIYPPERESEVLDILGPHTDQAYNYQSAAQRANEEIAVLTGRDLFFAWFNLGSSLVGLGDYQSAADAYDQAFALYQNLPEDDRPYRLMWYQEGPYQAYYHSKRYQDVVNLANTTFAWVGRPVLEESYYWRGLAFDALGERERAISDLEKAASLNPNYAPPREMLAQLGVEIP